MKLKKLRMRNFLSIGKKAVEFEFKEGITIFWGANGMGKSTFNAAKQFVISGKTSDKKNKKDLVNWFNNKNCMVEYDIEDDNGNDYTIGRTIAPDDVYMIKNGEKMKGIGKKEFTEEVSKLLKIDKKLSEQTVFLSKDFYKPFLRLTSVEKRNFLKDIFEFEIYEKMEEKFKIELKKIDTTLSKIQSEKDTKMALISEKSNRIEEDRKLIEEQYKERKNELEESKKLRKKLEKELVKEDESYEKHLNDLLDGYKDALRDFQYEEKEINIKIGNATNKKHENDQYKKEIEKLRAERNTYDIDTDLYTLSASKSALNKIEWQIDYNVEKINYYEVTNKCSECGNKYTKEEKTEKSQYFINENKRLYKEKLNFTQRIECFEIEEKIEKLEDRLYDIEGIDEYKNKLKEVQKNKIKLTEHIEDVNKRLNEYKEKVKVNKDIKKELEQLQVKIGVAMNALETLDNQVKRVDHSEKMVEKLNEEITKREQEIKQLFEKELIFKKLVIMVQDKGIKKHIISNYIPLLNKVAKRYTDMLNSEFTIKFDKTGLDVQIIKRGKEVGYWQLSSGERQRIDLSMLFVWLEFSRLRKNFVYPFLSLDEVLDSSLDAQGIADLISILQHIKENIPYIHIITHSSQNRAIADRIINVEKKGKYTQYKEES